MSPVAPVLPLGRCNHSSKGRATRLQSQWSSLYENTRCWLCRCCSQLKEEKLQALKVLCFHFIAVGDRRTAVRGRSQQFTSQPKSLTSDTQTETCWISANSVLSVNISCTYHRGRARRKSQFRPEQLKS